MGLTTWISFSPQGRQTRAVAGIVLLEDEVGPIERAALTAGFSIVAIHNPFLREVPKVVILRLEATGALDALSDSARRLLDAIRQGRSAKGLQAGPTRLDSGLGAAALERDLGVRPQAVEGVLKFEFGRPPFVGSAAFQGTMEKAAVSGRLALPPARCAEAVRALVEGGLEVVSLVSEAETGGPAVRVAYFWGVAPAERLARALKAALAQAGAVP